MDDVANSSNFVPTCVIRTEKVPIPAACLGITISLLFQLNASLLALSDQKRDANTSTPSNARQVTPEERYIKDTMTKGPKRLDLNSVTFVSAPTGSKGIFDSSSDDEAMEDSINGNFSDDQTGEVAARGLEDEIPEIDSSRTPSVTFGSDTRLLYIGSSNGSVSVYESTHGRRLATLEGAHAQSSVLAIQELHILDQSVVFASQGRDGFIRFWKLVLERKPKGTSGDSHSTASDDLPGMSELDHAGLKASIYGYRSSLFVGGEAFCKMSVSKESGYLAACCSRGMIGLWSYRKFLDHQDATNISQSEKSEKALKEEDFTLSAPECIISYAGDQLGMCMALQLEYEGVGGDLSFNSLSNETMDAKFHLLTGFEDGSISCWKIFEQSIVEGDSAPQEVVFGWRREDTQEKNEDLGSFESYRPLRTKLMLIPEAICSMRVFSSSTPILSLSMRRCQQILMAQPLSVPTTSSDVPKVPIITLGPNSEGKRRFSWIGIVTSAEDEVVTFSLNTCSSGVMIDMIEKYKMPHHGYGDVKVREDGLVAIAGWDFRIRLFLLEAFRPLANTSDLVEDPSEYLGDLENTVVFKMRALAILRLHSASIQSISFSSPTHEQCVSTGASSGTTTTVLSPEQTHENISNSYLCSSSNDHRVAVWKVY